MNILGWNSQAGRVFKSEKCTRSVSAVVAVNQPVFWLTAGIGCFCNDNDKSVCILQLLKP